MPALKSHATGRYFWFTVNITIQKTGENFAQCYKTFSIRNLQILVKARVFVSGNPCQPSLVIEGKVRSLP